MSCYFLLSLCRKMYIIGSDSHRLKVGFLYEKREKRRLILGVSIVGWNRAFSISILKLDLRTVRISGLRE